MKNIFLPIFILLACTPVLAINDVQGQIPIGCYDTFTIQRVTGPVYVSNDVNNLYLDITSLDKKTGPTLGALYVSDQTLAANTASKGKLCNIINYKR